MSVPSQICVRVPATSANVGVGFDCLGIALDMIATFTCAPSTDGQLHISGCERRFCGSDNLVWTSYQHACDAIGVPQHLLSITIDSPIPLTGGLGSSSACIVAGIAAAYALADLPLDRAAMLRLATSLEGHPDNVAPAILGGLVSTFSERGRVWPLRFDIADNLRFVAIIPPYEIRTAEARRVLPREVPLSTAVWQTGRCVAMVEALTSGDAALLAACAHDRLHEPYRAKLIPDFEALRGASLSAGASAFFISGSGATTIAVCDGDKHAEAVQRTLMTMERVSQAEGARRGLCVEILHAHAAGVTVS